jgi:2-polyprenyl-3-methyl-5-hydroxy-6-metoxy-1,4-benzoquinol methylase
MSEEKAPKDCSMQERRALYSKHKNVPTTDREARSLERVLWLYREMPRLKPKTVLDIGCESGFITRWMVDEPYVDSLLGIDPCEFSIFHANSLIRKRHHPEKAEYQVKGWEDQPIVSKLGHSQFQSVVCFEVLEHFLQEEGKLLIGKVNSLLSSGGTAVMCTPEASGMFGLKNPDPWHLKIYNRQEIEQLVKTVTGETVTFEDGDPNFILFKWSKR